VPRFGLNNSAQARGLSRLAGIEGYFQSNLIAVAREAGREADPGFGQVALT
jgi:hypothetical protein